MSDATLTGGSIHTTDAASKRAKARAAADRRLRFYGLAAIAFAVLALVVLLWSVFERAWSVRSEHYAIVEMTVPSAEVDPERPAAADFTGMVRDELKAAFPSASGRRERRQLYGLVSDGAADDLREEARAGELQFDQPMQRELLLSDDADLYLRGHFGSLVTEPGQGALTMELEGQTVALAASAGDFAEAVGAVKSQLRDQADRLRRQAARQANGIEVLTKQLETAEGEEADAIRAQVEGFTVRRDQLLAQADDLDARIVSTSTVPLELTDQMPSFFIRANGGILKLTAVSGSGGQAKALVPPDGFGEANDWSLWRMDEPEAGRTVKDLQIALLEDMRARGQIAEKSNWRFFSKGDSREAELAGIKGAVIGSLWTMLVTFLIAFPTGVLSAIYLEEFAPKNKLTDFIEVNINNLAAVPSIVFGLLGLAVFVTFFGVPRSTPLAGGLVLALMTLPTVVIASRAAIRAVPPSIRDAAMGLGASRMQTVFHHVLPLAMPGILTGAILGMAQALGETAPLLLIGMVAFITAVPEGVTDSATVLPVQVFIWANQSEQAFDYRTAAAIVVLLGFLVVMNLIAIVLRKKFERRW